MLPSNPDKIKPEPPDAAAAAHQEGLRAGEECRKAAHDYLTEFGLSPLALCPPDHVGCGKGHRCDSPGKRPLHPWKGLQVTHASLDQIDSWWGQHPNANVGITLGEVSGVVRVDVEGPAGEAKLREKSKGDLPPTWEFTTPRKNGSRGLLYAIPPGVLLRTTSEHAAAGEELRFMAKGSQTVLPPSRHPAGGRYTWKTGHAPWEIAPAPMPPWLVEQMREEAARPHAAPGSGEQVRFREGGRHTNLTRMAGKLRSDGLGQPALGQCLHAINETQCDPPLPRKEVDYLADDIDRRYAPDPMAGVTIKMTDPGAGDWEEPAPLGGVVEVPQWPTGCLAPWQDAFVLAVSEATQTPPDLAGVLVLAVTGAALAKKVRVQVRPGWDEPLNLWGVVAAPPGDRKTAVVAQVRAPVDEAQRQLADEKKEDIAHAASEHRTLEARLKHLEKKAAQAEEPEDREKYKQEARQAAVELARHKVPAEPKLVVEDITPEKLPGVLLEQSGRILQAGAEGTCFELIKGRYGNKPNFDAWLKAHAGDDIVVDRVSRAREFVRQPALSLAVAVQPDVVHGLAEHASMKGRGLLARPLYSIPKSWVGARKIKPVPVPAGTARLYFDYMLALWRLPEVTDANGELVAQVLRFSAGADRLMEEFEGWLEPQLAEGQDLSFLGGWANKLAGAIARIAGGLHLAEHIACGRAQCGTEIHAATVAAAIRLGRGYLLPHALAAFSLMGANEQVQDARHVWQAIVRSVTSVSSVTVGPHLISRRDINRLTHRRFKTVTDLDPVLSLLVREGYIRLVPNSGQPGRQNKSPVYEVNPLALAAENHSGPHGDTGDTGDTDRGDACED
jgi:hypothetical protein